MTAIEIFALAAALAMDAFSVSVSSGMNDNCNLKNALKMAFMFGLFQFLMPVFVNGASLFFLGFIEKYGAVIVFALLTFIGVRMIIGSARGSDTLPQNPFKLSSVIALSFATSVDALAAGISISANDNSVLSAAAVIGITAFVFSICGIFIGKFTKKLLPFPAEILGGVILIIIAVKSLLSFF